VTASECRLLQGCSNGRQSVRRLRVTPLSRRRRARAARTARPTENLVETVSPDGAQHIAVRQWRGGCSEKLAIHIRYSQRGEWIDVGLMP
jgi:hypothetical protein